MKNLTSIQRSGVEYLDGLLNAESATASRDSASRMLAEASQYGISLRDFLTLKIDPKLSADAGKFADLSGYEASLLHLGLPVRNDLKNGIVLEAAAETFQTYAGTRALFPEVMDDVVRWAYRQDQLEQVGNLIANKRSINGVEMITTVVNDNQAEYQRSATVAEGARFPIYSIRSSEVAVKMWKHGMGYRTSYEFERRARLDLLTPYANRAIRESEISKVGTATGILVNGDGVHAAAPVIAQSDFNAAVGTSSVNGRISYLHLLHWLVSRAKARTPVDTVVGNYDAYIQWLMMFAVPKAGDRTDAQDMAAAGFRIQGVPLLTGVVNFELSSLAPAGKLIGFSRADTLEELEEAGALISESERSITNQTITYVRSEVTGYRLVFDGTRSIYNFAG
jgi:hypothetical protein